MYLDLMVVVRLSFPISIQINVLMVSNWVDIKPNVERNAYRVGRIFRR